MISILKFITLHKLPFGWGTAGMIRMLQTPNPTLRFSAFKYLKDQNWEHAHLDEEIWYHLGGISVGEAVFDEWRDISETSLRRLKEIGAASAPAILKLLNHKGPFFQDRRDMEVRCVLVDLLKDIGDQVSVPDLINAYSRQTNLLVTPEIILALGKIGGAKALEWLLTFKSNYRREMLAHIKALGMTESPKAVPILLDHLKTESAEIIASAALSLGQIGDESAVLALQELLGDNREGYIYSSDPRLDNSIHVKILKVNEAAKFALTKIWIKPRRKLMVSAKESFIFKFIDMFDLQKNLPLLTELIQTKCRVQISTADLTAIFNKEYARGGFLIVRERHMDEIIGFGFVADGFTLNGSIFDQFFNLDDCRGVIYLEAVLYVDPRYKHRGIEFVMRKKLMNGVRLGDFVGYCCYQDPVLSDDEIAADLFYLYRYHTIGTNIETVTFGDQQRQRIHWDVFFRQDNHAND